jgi:hypothetical protein
VDQSALADYTKVIPNLIDFATIRSKLGTGNTYVSCTLMCLLSGCYTTATTVSLFFCLSDVLFT